MFSYAKDFSKIIFQYIFLYDLKYALFIIQNSKKSIFLNKSISFDSVVVIFLPHLVFIYSEEASRKRLNFKLPVESLILFFDVRKIK